MLNCTSDALPVAKYRFFRIDADGEREVSSSSSDTTGIMIVSSIMHAASAYNVTYKCVPYNMLGNGVWKTTMVDVQGMHITTIKVHLFCVHICLVNYVYILHLCIY